MIYYYVRCSRRRNDDGGDSQHYNNKSATTVSSSSILHICLFIWLLLLCCLVMITNTGSVVVVFIEAYSTIIQKQQQQQQQQRTFSKYYYINHLATSSSLSGRITSTTSGSTTHLYSTTTTTTSSNSKDIPPPSSTTTTTTTTKPKQQRNHMIHRFISNMIMQRSSQSTEPKKMKSKKLKVPLVNITTIEQLDAHWEDRLGLYRYKKDNTKINYDLVLQSANIIGDTQMIGASTLSNYTHPVVQLLHLRKKEQQLSTSSRTVVQDATTTTSVTTTTNTRDTTAATAAATTTTTRTSSSSSSLYNDGCKVALCIEGGGMRGCVSAGMVCAIHYLNLTNTIDVVYGSSAGTVVGAYLITKQLPYFGPEVYYDRLTTAGTQFIDTKRILRAIGFGLLDVRLLRDVITRRRDGGKPVLNLSFLLKTTVQQTKPLDWNTFVQRQSVQPLHIVTSGLSSNKSIVFTMENNGFQTLDELTNCMHASCLLPGIAGPIMNLDKSVLNNNSFDATHHKKMVLGNNLDLNRYEPIADALLYEPLPYQTAITEHNVTHCIVLRTRPDGTDVTGKGGLFEKLIAKRFFQRKNQLAHQYLRMKMHLHKKIYGANIIQLNEAAYSLRDCYNTSSEPHLMTVAIPPGSEEVSRLEVGRKAIFEGLRRGFARAYDCLVEDPNERGRGVIVAKEYFPDEILEYDPLVMDSHSTGLESAFDAYMRLNGVIPKAWESSKQ